MRHALAILVICLFSVGCACSSGTIKRCCEPCVPEIIPGDPYPVPVPVPAEPIEVMWPELKLPMAFAAALTTKDWKSVEDAIMVDYAALYVFYRTARPQIERNNAPPK